jgi:hypothetical protein
MGKIGMTIPNPIKSINTVSMRVKMRLSFTIQRLHGLTAQQASGC